MNGAHWITESGARVRAKPEDLPPAASALAASLDQDYRAPFSRGWVGFTEAPGQVTVRIDLDSPADRALAATMAALEATLVPVSIVYRRDAAWVGDSTASGRCAAARLDELTGEAGFGPSRHVRISPIELGSMTSSLVTPLLRRGFKSWERARGIFSDRLDDLEALLPESQLNLPDEIELEPRFLFVGPKSPSARVFGQAWSSNAEFETTVPDRKFNDEVIGVYRQVARRRDPAAALVRARVQRPDGEHVWIAYQRLVLPMTFVSGAPVLNCLASFVPFCFEPPAAAA